MPAVRPSSAYADARLKTLRRSIKTRRLDALLLTAAHDLGYAANFPEPYATGIVTPSEVVLVTDGRFTEQIKRDAPTARLVLRKTDMPDAVAAELKRLNLTRVGFDPDTTTYALAEALKRALGDDGELVPTPHLVADQRQRKDKLEVDLIRRAIDTAEAAYAATLPHLVPGVSESELAGRLIFEMRSRGADDAAFLPIIGAGANAALCHHRSGPDVARDNDVLLLDWGCVRDGYCSDLTRTHFLGKPPKKLARVYEVVLDAQLTAIDAIKPGVTTHEAHAVAADVIKRDGFAKFFPHGLGHSMGRNVHEEPRMNPLYPDVPLEPGMVLTVEPGVYLPGVGGVRIEDDVLVTRTGCEVLSRLPKTLASCVIAG